MAQFVTNESSEDSFTLSATQPWHLDTSNYIVLNQTTQVQAFTAAQFSGVHIYALDHNNAQLLLDRQAFVGYLLNPNDQAGLNNIALPAGQWWIGVTYNGSSLSSGQTVAGFDEVSTVSLPGASFIGNVPMGVGGNAGAWRSQGFTITGSPSLYIETEGSGGKFMIQTPSQYQAFQSVSSNEFGRYSFIYALGGTSGGADTEIEGQLQLPAGTYYLTWINDSGGWAGGAADISAFGNGSVSADAASPSGPSSTSNTATVSGTPTQYNVANNNGSLYIQDLVPNRDGTQVLPGNTQINFTDSTGVFDPTGNAEEVARLYQAALGRAPDVGGLDGWTAQLNAHTLGIDGVALGFINSAEFSSKYGTLDNADFVTQLYQNVLHRAPDSGGEQGWINQLNGGITRAQVLIGFSDSLENKLNTQGTIGDPHMDEAYRLYQAALDRTPDTPGLGGWTAQLDSGISPLQVAQGFVSSNEFAQLFAGLDTKGFVDQLYQNVLHRAPDSAGEQGWINQLNGGTSKAQVLLGFSDSLENRLNTSRATHDGWVLVHS